MKKITQSPHLVFWVLIPVLLLIGYIDSNETIAINIYDTYFVVTMLNLGPLLSIVCGIIGLGYWIIFFLKKKLINWLTILHAIVTIIGFLIILLIPLLSPELNQNDPSLNLEYYFDTQVITTLSVLVVISIQLLYPINIIAALVKKTN
ncbi:hypothetical protein CLV90_0007 [Maribacter spongiicola]|uniref:Uncharacterized protein n=1 Tax=Maribacter spongiicola TaxID=1206753 RepID=A0A4R7KD61_9FLAO|nr:hypothetical protein [Maribacter spongiicola]TDT50688.1 hypothetical protein CLV90_0007 [Maribacter spongiicola]